MKKDGEDTKEVTKKLNDKYNKKVADDGIEILDEVPASQGKFKSSTVAIILLSITTILLGCLIFVKRDAIFTSNIVVEKEEEPKKVEPSTIIAAEDTYALALGKDFGIQFYVLHDGELYYKIDDYSEIGNFENYRVIDYNVSASYDIPKELKHYTALTGIKRLKAYNFANSVSYSLILIMNDGAVYRLTYTFYTNQFTLTKLNIFGDYKVDDIKSLDISSECTSNNCAASYEIITLDGKTITK